MNDNGEKTGTRRIVKAVDDALAKKVQASADSPLKRWAWVVLVPLLLSGSCWAGAELSLKFPGIGQLEWHGDGTE